MRGNFASSSASRSAAVRARTLQEISVPPDSTCTQNVSGRRASAAAMGSAASGVQRSRTVHEAWPSRAALTAPTTRSTPAERSLSLIHI